MCWFFFPCKKHLKYHNYFNKYKGHLITSPTRRSKNWKKTLDRAIYYVISVMNIKVNSNWVCFSKKYRSLKFQAYFQSCRNFSMEYLYCQFGSHEILKTSCMKVKLLAWKCKLSKPWLWLITNNISDLDLKSQQFNIEPD